MPLWLLVSLIAVAQLAALFWLIRRQRVPASHPDATPEDPKRAPESPQLLEYVRRTEHGADIAAITRRLEQLAAEIDARHQQLTGMIGNLKRQDRSASKEELAVMLTEQLRDRREAQPAPVELKPGLRQVRISR